ncbi:MAG: creatininase family protein, partial [Cyanobacteria bacterium]|nr:creatininase family protein [Cyanobacteriota bacterium]
MTESTNLWPGILLERNTWREAEPHLTSNSVVVIPLGAQCKQHGLHLKLNNDWLIAEYLKQRVREKLPVVIAPTINYSFYPAMVDYPGTVSLRSETARDMVIDICESLSRFGPRYFYILNTGISTIRPLANARD